MTNGASKVLSSTRNGPEVIKNVEVGTIGILQSATIVKGRNTCSK